MPRSMGSYFLPVKFMTASAAVPMTTEQNGVELKNNIKEYWWKFMTQLHDNIVGIDSAIFMHPTVWKASGHVDAFNDPMMRQQRLEETLPCRCTGGRCHHQNRRQG